MKLSQFFISTLREAPAEAEVVSHKLMLRAGFIKRLSAGIYTYMPMGLRVIRKVEAIVREEMTRAGAVELLMPLVQPAELWQETGRFEKMGPELLRIQDRHGRDFVVQPTSEEVITDVARRVLAGAVLKNEWISASGAQSLGGASALVLTPRQQETLVLLSNGHSNKEIGLRMGLAEITVKVHVSAVFRALDVVNRTQAVLAARRMGLSTATDEPVAGDSLGSSGSAP